MKLTNIQPHAIQKYKEITRKEEDDIILEYEIRELFDKSFKEKMNADLVKRIMKNNFEETEYYLFNDLRFVVCKNRGGKWYMRTVEKNLYRSNK